MWGAFDFTFISLFLGNQSMWKLEGFNYFFILFFAVHLIPVWIAIIGPIYRFIIWKNVEYVLTNKRIYISSGMWGTDITSLEMREITNLTVNVNPIEHRFNLGTIKLTPDANVSANGNSLKKGWSIEHIKNPYDIYHLIKDLSLDVVTDQQFPNAYRPQENPGYNTKVRNDYYEYKE